MKKILIVIGILSVLAGGSIFLLTANTHKKAVSEFDVGGYIIDEVKGEEATEAVNTQYYFNSGEVYTENKSANTVSFKTVDGAKATVNRDSFVHYNDNAKESFAKSVLLDADALDDAALSYYSVMDGTKLHRESDGYHINNGGEDLVFKNFIWKISDTDYMVVSDTVDLVISDDDRQQFTDYVQVKYKDSGIVHILTQQGTYSTISSDAYLELANGVRIYLGSKNVSDGEEKKMNLTQMLVNSEDNIEVIPDQEFKNENVKEPKIVVEANDGEDGEDGEPGEAGKAGNAGIKGQEGEAGEEGAEGDEGSSGSDGSTGKAGSAGQNGQNGTNGGTGNTGGGGNPGDGGGEGDPGEPGKNASTAGVTYSEEQEPKFHVTDFSANSYSCEAEISFEQDTTDPNIPYIYTDTVNVKIIESESGRTVYDVTPGAWIQNPFSIETDSLTPSTNYTMVVNTKYKTPSGLEYQKDVLTKYFVTSSIGLTLEQKSVTESTFIGNLIKTDDNNIGTLCVRVYNAEKEQISGVYLIPQDAEIAQTYNPGTGVFTIQTASESQLGVGESTPLRTGQLTHNTDYYAQIAVASYVNDDPSQPTQKNYTFPLVPFKTLKLAPEVEAPYVALAGSENAFTASARYISDPDNGIVSYRYELFVATDITEIGGESTVSAKPIYTVNANSASAVKIPVDGVVVKEDVNYRIRLIAVFDNNESIVEYPSNFSDIICFNSSELWPTVINNSDIITCSTIEGRVELTDNSFVLPRETGNAISLYLKPTYKMYKLVNGKIEYWDDEVLIGKVEDLTSYSSTAKITIPYQTQGLKYDTNYSIVVRANRMTENGEIKDNVNIGSISIATKPYTYSSSSPSEAGYIPLKINGTSGQPSGQQTFREYVFFSSGAWSEEKTDQSVIDGVGSMQHFSSKAMEYVKFELRYTEGTEDILLGTTEPIFLPGYSKPENYRFVKDPTNAVRYNIYDENDTDSYSAAKWAEILAEAQAHDSDTPGHVYDGFGIKLTADRFQDAADPTTYLSYDKIISKLGFEANTLTIRPVVYDYTYVSGNGTQTWWKNPTTSDCNKILCINDYTVHFTMAPPSYETLRTSPFKYEVITIGAAQNKIATYEADKATHKISNYVDTLPTVWNEYDKTTAAGIVISGPQNGELWRYADTIKYTIYAEPPTSTAVVPLGSSPDLTVSVSDKKLPSWTYLMDSTLLEMKRGTTFYVTVSATLNGQISGFQGMTYPDDFINNPQGAIADVTGYIWNNDTGFCLAKQVPEVRVAQYDAAYGENNESITYLLNLKDLDEAVIKEASPSDVPQFYLSGTATDSQVPQSNRVYEDNTVPGSETIFEKLLTILSKKQAEILNLHYRLKDSDTADGVLNIDTYTNNIMPGKNLKLVTDGTGLDSADKVNMRIVGDNYVSVSTQSEISETKEMGIEFWYQADAPKDLSRVDIDIHGYNGTAAAAGGTHVKFTFTGNDINTDESYVKTVGPDTTTYYCAKVKLSIVQEEALIPLSSYDNMQVSIKAYQDSGRFGLKYVDVDTFYASQTRTKKAYVNPDHVEVVDYYSAICSTGADTTPDPVIYSASDIQIRYMLKTAAAEVPTTSKLTYNADGLDYIPRESKQLPIDGKQISNPLKNILPDYKTTVDAGYSLANMKLVLDGGKGTLVGDASGNMITVFYNAGDLGTIHNEYSDNITAGIKHTEFKATELTKDNNWTAYKEITGLTKDTTYSYKIFGYSNGAWKLLMTLNGSMAKVEGASFKTDQYIDIKYVSSPIEYHASADDKKNVQVTYKVTDAYYRDIKECLSETASKLAITQHLLSGDSPAGQNSTIVAEMKKAFLPGYTEAQKMEAGPQSYTFSVETDWSPKAEHIMNNSAEYIYETTFTYSSTDTSVIEVHDIPYSWKGVATPSQGYEKKYGNGTSTVGLVPVVGYDKTAATPSESGTFGVSIQGKDQLRLFRQDAGMSHNKVTYEVELLKYPGVKVGETIVKTANIQDTGAIGYINYKYCMFTNLINGEKYCVRVTARWDNNNDGVLDTTGWQTLTQYKTIPASGITFTSLDLEPDKQRAGCGGSNLNYVIRVEYTLKVNGGEETYHGVLKNSGATGTDAKPWSYWQEDPNRPDRYNLIIPEMNDINQNYELVVKLWDAGASEPAEMINYYGKKTDSGILSSFVSWLTGN